MSNAGAPAAVEFGAGRRGLVDGLSARPEARGGHHPVGSVRPAAVVVVAEVSIITFASARQLNTSTLRTRRVRGC